VEISPGAFFVFINRSIPGYHLLTLIAAGAGQ
jgi:hypothetical protein